MEKQEFFLLIPAIIYGVAIVDLLKIFQHKKNYWEVITWGLLLLIIIINTWIELYQKLGTLLDSNVNFFIIIAQAMLYAQAAGVITPEEKDTDTREYFFDVKKTFFLILAVVTAWNLLVQYVVFDDHREPWIRPTGIILSLICAYVDRIWVRGIIAAFIGGLAVIMVFLN